MRNEGLAQALAHTLTCGADINARRLFLIGEVDENMAKHFLATFQVLDNTEGAIFVTLNSPGGSVDHGFAIYDAIRLSRNPVFIDVFGKAMSMGVVILQAADWRRIAPEARLMIHEVSYSVEDASFSELDLSDEAAQMKKLNERVLRALSVRSNGKLSFEKAKELCERDYFMSGEDSVKLGIADEVLTVTKSIRVVPKDQSEPTVKRKPKSNKKKGKKK